MYVDMKSRPLRIFVKAMRKRLYNETRERLPNMRAITCYRHARLLADQEVRHTLDEMARARYRAINGASA